MTHRFSFAFFALAATGMICRHLMAAPDRNETPKAAECEWAGYSADGKSIVASVNGHFALFDAKHGQVQSHHSAPGPKDSSAMSGDGSCYIESTSKDNSEAVRSSADGKILFRNDLPVCGDRRHYCLSYRGDMAWATADGILTKFSFRDAKPVWSERLRNKRMVYFITASRDGALVAIGYSDTVAVYDGKNGNALHEWQADVNGATLFPFFGKLSTDGKSLVVVLVNNDQIRVVVRGEDSFDEKKRLELPMQKKETIAWVDATPDLSSVAVMTNTVVGEDLQFKTSTWIWRQFAGSLLHEDVDGRMLQLFLSPRGTQILYASTDSFGAFDVESRDFVWGSGATAESAETKEVP